MNERNDVKCEVVNQSCTSSMIRLRKNSTLLTFNLDVIQLTNISISTLFHMPVIFALGMLSLKEQVGYLSEQRWGDCNPTRSGKKKDNEVY